MIAKHVSCKAKNDDYGRLARYIADAGHDGEKCLVSWSAGCWSEDDYDTGIVEAEAVQNLNTRSAREKTYHLLISFRPEDEAKLTDRSLSMKKLESRLGQFQLYRSLRPIQELSRYQAVPLHRGPERGELFTRYRQGIESRKKRLEAVKERENTTLAAVRKQWADKRAEIERMEIAKKETAAICWPWPASMKPKP